MKSAVLARPNLKLFMYAAIIMAGIGQFTGSGHSQSGTLVQARASAQLGSDDYIHQLFAQAAQNATPELFRQLSAAYEQRGDVRKALTFLRFADRLAEDNKHHYD